MTASKPSRSDTSRSRRSFFRLGISARSGLNAECPNRSLPNPVTLCPSAINIGTITAPIYPLSPVNRIRIAWTLPEPSYVSKVAFRNLIRLFSADFMQRLGPVSRDDGRTLAVLLPQLPGRVALAVQVVEFLLFLKCVHALP